MAFEKLDIITLVIIGIGISAAISIPMGFYDYALSNAGNPSTFLGAKSQETYNYVNQNNQITQEITTNTPPKLTCAINDPGCEDGLTPTTSIPNTGFDVIQSKVNWVTIMSTIIWMFAKTTVAPILLAGFFSRMPFMAASPFLWIPVTIILGLWQMAVVGVFWKLFKR